MPYYLAEIRFNIASKDAKSERKVKKRLVARLVTILLACLLVLTPILIVPAAVGSDQPEVIEALEDLCKDISELPDDAFNNSRAMEGQRKALCNKVRAVIHQVKAGAYEGAVNKLRNDIENAIEGWIMNPWKNNLIEEVENIIDKILDTEPPVIADVWREPETPAYNEAVTVKVNVTDEGSGVKSVILSYSIDMINWENVTMEKVDELYVGEIPAFLYGTTVNYKIYAYDKAGNLATAGQYSYTVIDPYPPTISNVKHSPLSPSFEETVSVSAEVAEPSNASGVELVILSYWNGSDWTNVTMTMEDMLYTETIPALPNGTTVQYKILARDSAGNWADSDVFSYTVGAPPPPILPPVAEFTESAETVYTGETIFFNASSSYDPDGAIFSYEWAFGDDTFANGVTTSHSYADDGVYTVTLIVTDDDGATNSTSAVKTVLNRPPVAILSESAEIVDTGVVITFDTSDSYDLDGEIVSYHWDFGDDFAEIYVKDVNLTAIATHSYADNGAYTVTLTVTDDDGATDLTSTTKKVLNRSPIASFTQNATTVDVGEAIHFDASGSSDLDGDIVEYFWDFDDLTDETGVTVDHVYTEGGNYTVTLFVTDDDGATSTFSVEITVKALQYHGSCTQRSP